MDTTPELKKARAAAAFAYINREYIQEEHKKEGVKFPADDASYEDYVKFYQEGDGKSSVDDLYDIFEKNGKEIDQWNKNFTRGWKTFESNNDSEHQSRWKDVAKYELVSRLTDPKDENVNKSDGSSGGLSRLFNAEPIENILCPYEGRDILDDFLPTAKEDGNTKRASINTVQKMAECTHKRFIESGLLSEVLDEVNKKDDASEKSHKDRLLGKYKTGTDAQKEAAFKKDILSGFFQPLGNYRISDVPEERVGRTIAWDKCEKTFFNNISRQINGADELEREANEWKNDGLRIINEWRTEHPHSNVESVAGENALVSLDNHSQKILTTSRHSKSAEEREKLDASGSKLQKGVELTKKAKMRHAEAQSLRRNRVSSNDDNVSLDSIINKMRAQPSDFKFISTDILQSEDAVEEVMCETESLGEIASVQDLLGKTKKEANASGYSLPSVGTALQSFASALGNALKFLATPFVFVGSLFAAPFKMAWNKFAKKGNNKVNSVSDESFVENPMRDGAKAKRPSDALTAASTQSSSSSISDDDFARSDSSSPQPSSNELMNEFIKRRKSESDFNRSQKNPLDVAVEKQRSNSFSYGTGASVVTFNNKQPNDNNVKVEQNSYAHKAVV